MATASKLPKLPPLALDNTLSSGTLFTAPRRQTVRECNEDSVRDWINNNDVKRLEHFVIAGKGDLLLKEISCREESQNFLQQVPQLMKKVDELLTAAASGDTGRLKLLLEDRRYIRARDRNGWGLLHCAVAGGHVAMVEFLVTNYPEVLRLRDSARQVDGNSSAISSEAGALASGATVCSHNREYRRHLRHVRLLGNCPRHVVCRLLRAPPCCLGTLPPLRTSARRLNAPPVRPRVVSHWSRDERLGIGGRRGVRGRRAKSSNSRPAHLRQLQPVSGVGKNSPQVPDAPAHCFTEADPLSSRSTGSHRTALASFPQQIAEKSCHFGRGLTLPPLNDLTAYPSPKPTVPEYDQISEDRKKSRSSEVVNSDREISPVEFTHQKKTVKFTQNIDCNSTAEPNYIDRFPQDLFLETVDQMSEDICEEVLVHETAICLVDRTLSTACLTVAKQLGLMVTR